MLSPSRSAPFSCCCCCCCWLCWILSSSGDKQFNNEGDRVWGHVGVYEQGSWTAEDKCKVYLHLLDSRSSE
uniref:Putative secreted protein n=1 Tax=Anopheles darlingi TaxID=43151 RepID=A0A2M4DIX4_ANODA